MREAFPHGLKWAKGNTDAVLEGEVIELECKSGEFAEHVSRELTAVGFVVEIKKPTS